MRMGAEVPHLTTLESRPPRQASSETRATRPSPSPTSLSGLASLRLVSETLRESSTRWERLSARMSSSSPQTSAGSREEQPTMLLALCSK